MEAPRFEQAGGAAGDQRVWLDIRLALSGNILWHPTLRSSRAKDSKIICVSCEGFDRRRFSITFSSCRSCGLNTLERSGRSSPDVYDSTSSIEVAEPRLS